MNNNPMSISYINGTFTLDSLRIPWLWVSYLNVTITAYRMGNVSSSQFYFNLNTTYNWYVALNISNIDRFTVTSSPASAMPTMSIDDICITA